MNDIGLICGDGNLPIHIGNNLIKKKYNITFFVLNSVTNKTIYKNYNHINIDILSIKKIINILKKNNVKNIILAGSLKRPSLNDLGFDIETIKLAKYLFLEKKGDNNLLISIKNYLEKKGFIFFNWTKHCPELFSFENQLTKHKPSKQAYNNFLKAKSIYKDFKKMDVGQSIIIQNQLVLGLEAIEGTDKLIERCSFYKRKGDRGVLLKFTKKNQSDLIDIPLIGLETLKEIKKFNYEGIYLEKNKCLIIDKENVIKFANKNKIFVSCVELN